MNTEKRRRRQERNSPAPSGEPLLAIPPAEKRTCFTLLGLLLLLTFAAFSVALQNQFTNWDDAAYVPDNILIRRLNYESVHVLFTRFFAGNYHPLTLLTYMIEYRFVGPKPWLYILNNILLHLANTVLTFALVQSILHQWKLALVVTALFALHPTRVESVAWISERKDVLCTFFFLASLLAYVAHIKRPRTTMLILSWTLLLVSLLAKAMSMTQPLVLLLLDYYLGRKWSWRIILEKTPFFILAFGFGLLALYAQSEQGAVANKSIKEAYAPLLFACHGLIFYAGTLLFPYRLSNLYPSPYTVATELSAEFYLAPFLLAALAVIAWLLIGKTRLGRFGILFFLVTIGPVLQLVPVGMAIAADRYTYIPALGLFLIVVKGAAVLLERHGRSQLLLRITLPLTIAMAGACAWRCTVWRTSETLWTDMMSKYPHAAIAYGNRSQYYLTTNQPDKALADVDKAIELDPGWRFSYINRAIIKKSRGDYQGALDDLAKTLQLDPDSVIALNNRATILIDSGIYDLAIEDLNKVIAKAPDYLEPYRNRSIAYERKGDLAAARRDLEYVLKLDPKSPDGFYAMGAIADQEGRYEDALRYLTMALEVMPDVGDFLAYRGTVYLSLQKPVEAEADFLKVLQHLPGSPEAWSNIATARRNQGRFEDALKDYTKAVELAPNRAEFHSNRGTVLADLQRYEDAIDDQTRAIELNPNLYQAWFHRASAHIKLNQPEEALGDLTECLRLKPDYALARSYRAVAWSVVGNYDKAWEDVTYLQSHGFAIDPPFLGKLEAATGKSSTH